MALFRQLWRHNLRTKRLLHIKLGRVVDPIIFYVKIKSFCKIYDTCCGQKLQNDEKNDIDDVTNTSKMSDMPQNFFNIIISKCLDNGTYQLSSPYKVFNLLTVANMSEKNTSRLMGGVHPPRVNILTETTYLFPFHVLQVSSSPSNLNFGVIPPWLEKKKLAPIKCLEMLPNRPDMWQLSD